MILQREESYVTDVLPKTLQKTFLSKGIIKQLLWIENGDLVKAVRVRFTSDALRERSGVLGDLCALSFGKRTPELEIFAANKEVVDTG